MLKEYQHKPLIVKAVRYTKLMQQILEEMADTDPGNNPTSVELTEMPGVPLMWNKHTKRLTLLSDAVAYYSTVCVAVGDWIVQEDKQGYFKVMTNKNFKKHYEEANNEEMPSCTCRQNRMIVVHEKKQYCNACGLLLVN